MSRLQGYNSFMFQLNRDTTKGLLTGILGRKTMKNNTDFGKELY